MDGSGFPFIEFDVVTGGQEIKIAILVNVDFLSRYFLFLINIVLLSSLLAIFVHM